jgi:hypothetical protein
MQGTSYSEYPVKFLFFGQTVVMLEICPCGDLFLRNYTGISYHLVPFHYTTNQPECQAVYSFYYFKQINTTNDLKFLSDRVQAAFPTTSYSSFQATTAYMITWQFNDNVNTSLLQLFLCVDANSLFMIINYAELNLPSDTIPYFYDTQWQEYTFQVS